MFSEATLRYFERLPTLPGVDPREIRGALSTVYTEILAAMLDGDANSGSPETDQLLRLRVRALPLLVLSTGDALKEEARTAAAFVAAEALDLSLGKPIITDA